jgi:hypothetical protein
MWLIFLLRYNELTYLSFIWLEPFNSIFNEVLLNFIQGCWRSSMKVGPTWLIQPKVDEIESYAKNKTNET